MPRHKTRGSTTPPATVAARRTDRLAARELLLLVLASCLPILFWRRTAEVFEVPKAALLLSVSLLLAAHALAAAVARLAEEGAATWHRGVFSRAAGALRRDPLAAAILIFLASSLASTLTSPSPAMSAFGAPESRGGLWTALATATVYFVSARLAGDTDRLARLAAAVSIGAAVSSGYALVQILGLDPWDWGRIATYRGQGRAFGTLGQPNLLAAYLLTALPLIVWLASRTRGAQRIGLGAVGAMSLLAIIASLSRGAWIGLVAGGLVWAALRFGVAGRFPVAAGGGGASPSGARPFPAAIPIVALALATVALISFTASIRDPLLERFRELGTLRAPSSQSRLYLWRAGLQMFADHPVLGVGTDAFSAAFPRYRTTGYWRVEWGATPLKAHSEPINLLATQGAFGGAAALLVVLASAWAILRAVRSPSPGVRNGACAAGAALAGFAVQDLFGFTVVSTGALAAALAGWIAAAAPLRPRPVEGHPGTHRERPARGRSVAWVVYAGAAAAMLPLVLRPLGAELALQSAELAPPGREDRIHSLERGAALAPWDVRAPIRLNRAFLDAAEQVSDDSLRRRLVALARAAGERATRVGPWDGYAWLAFAQALAAQCALVPPDATIEAARTAFLEARRRDPANAMLLTREAELFIGLGRPDLGHPPAMRALQLYPGIAGPLGLLGYLALSQNRNADGVDTLQIAVGRDWLGERFAEASAWSNLSVGYIRLGQAERSLEAARRALAIEPDHADARENLAVAERALRRATPQ